MSRRAMIAVTTCFLFFAVNAASTQAKPGNGKISREAVRIAVLSDMSGVYSEIGGKGSVVAAQMAADAFGGAWAPA